MRLGASLFEYFRNPQATFATPLLDNFLKRENMITSGAAGNGHRRGSESHAHRATEKLSETQVSQQDVMILFQILA